MHRFLLVSGFCFLVLTGCRNAVEPLPPGVVTLAVRMEETKVLVDHRGNHLDIQDVVIRIDHPTLVTTAGSCVNGCTPTKTKNEVHLTGGRTVEIGSWEIEDPLKSIRLELSPANTATVLPEGRTVMVIGFYNGLATNDSTFYGLFVLPLTIDTTLTLSAPSASVDEQGVRLEIVFDPTEWFYNERIEEIESIADVMKPVPDQAILDRIKKRIVESFVLSSR